MIKINNIRSNGKLFHYAHFIMDCLFNEIINDVHTHKCVIRKKNIDQTIGEFYKIYEEVMKIKNVELSESRYETINATEIKTARIDNPTKEQIDKYRNFIFNRYNIQYNVRDIAYPEILLIVRGNRIELIKDEQLKKQIKYKNVRTGKERREIHNIDLLETYLKQQFQDIFKAVMLENLSFYEQIKYFNNAKLIIGIHGAGLANVLFCNKGATLLEIYPDADYGWHFLNNSCKVLELQHIVCANDIDVIKKKIDEIKNISNLTIFS